jgi:hypothetical protein
VFFTPSLFASLGVIYIRPKQDVKDVKVFKGFKGFKDFKEGEGVISLRNWVILLCG